ncbi:MAG: hypothetical protein KF778_14945 [Rhodocyclaceae bacterium]|nr:hypothetical protein [Rhodocyclaceae bacterium]
MLLLPASAAGGLSTVMVLPAARLMSPSVLVIQIAAGADVPSTSPAPSTTVMFVAVGVGLDRRSCLVGPSNVMLLLPASAWWCHIYGDEHPAALADVAAAAGYIRLPPALMLPGSVTCAIHHGDVVAVGVERFDESCWSGVNNQMLLLPASAWWCHQR